MTTGTNGNGKAKSDQVIFGTPDKVWRLTEDMQSVEKKRAEERSWIDNLFNGGRPWTPEEVKKHDIQLNVNWGDGKRIAADGNRQINTALLHPGTLFTCTTDYGDVNKRAEWAQTFTKLLHEPFQRGRSARRHHFLIRARNASVVLHGIGAILWSNDFDWLGRFVPLEDLLIPTDTSCDFSNLRYFAVNLYLTPGELVDMTQGETADKGWNTKMVRQILNALRQDLYANENVDWMDRPEHAQEIHKQNRGYNQSDAVPKVKLRAFYFKDADTGKWYRRIILRENLGDVMAGGQDEFVYDGGDTVFADHIDHILNIQYADCSLVPPLRYHSVRGLGVDLFAPVEALNRLRCEFVQHVFENMKMYFRIQDPADRDRLKQVVLQQFGFIPEGLNIVRRDERHQIDAGLVDQAMGQMRQNMQESSSSYVSDQNPLGSKKELREVEAQAIINKANMLVSGMLQMMYVQEGFYYEEELRRFCLPQPEDEKLGDPVVKRFQRKCKEAGIPPELIKSERWQLTPERVLGGGDRSQAQAQSMFLLQNLPMLEPTAQQKAKRWAFATMLEDPDKARLLIPEAPVTATTGALSAESRFGTLMQGVALSPIEGIPQMDYIKSMLRMAILKLQSATQQNPIGTPELLAGLTAVLTDAGEHVKMIAQDENNKQMVKVFGDVISRISNELQAVKQRQDEAMQAQQPQGTDPEAAAKAQSLIIQAQTKAKLSEAMAMLKMEQKQKQFQQKQQQDAQRHALDSQIAVGQAQVEAFTKAATRKTE